MVVGVASLFVVVYQAQLQREQTELERRAQAASVLPYLMIVTTINDQGVFLNVRNTGLGPARLERVQVLHRGAEFMGDAADFYFRMRNDSSLPTDIDQLKPGRLIPAGEWVMTLGTGNTASKTPMLKELLRLFEIAELQPSMYQEYDSLVAKSEARPREKAVLEITYASVFGEQWVLRSDGYVPQPLQAAAP